MPHSVKGILVFTALLILYSAGGTILGLLFPGSTGASLDPKAILPVFGGACWATVLILITYPSVVARVKKGS
jgi:hypothetical protein